LFGLFIGQFEVLNGIFDGFLVDRSVYRLGFFLGHVGG